MIEVDISNIWGDISLPDLLGLEKDVFLAHQALTGEQPAWMCLPGETEINRILAIAEEIRECSDTLVVIGGDGAARGITELFGDGQKVLFLEGTLSTRSRNALLHRLEGKDYSLCVCSDGRFWDSLALRELKWLLERRCGTDEAHSRIHHDPLGLITMAAAGVDIRELLRGAEAAGEALDLLSYENPAWLYGAARCLMAKKGRNTETLVFAEPEFAGLGSWWRRTFCAADAEIVLSCALFPEELTCAGGRQVFRTMLRFDPPEKKTVIGETVQDPTGLNFLAGSCLDQVEDAAWETALEEQTDMGTPVIGIRCGELCPRTAGEMLRFFRLSAALYGRLAGQTAPDTFETDVLRRLGKPEF